MKWLLFLSVSFLLLMACTPVDKPLQAIIDGTDQVKITKYTASDTIIRRTTDEKDIAIFTELLKGQEDNSVAGNSVGEIIYSIKGDQKLSAIILRDGVRFTLDGKAYSRRFTYRAGMYLGEMK